MGTPVGATQASPGARRDAMCRALLVAQLESAENERGDMTARTTVAPAPPGPAACRDEFRHPGRTRLLGHRRAHDAGGVSVHCSTRLGNGPVPRRDRARAAAVGHGRAMSRRLWPMRPAIGDLPTATEYILRDVFKTYQLRTQTSRGTAFPPSITRGTSGRGWDRHHRRRVSANPRVPQARTKRSSASFWSRSWTIGWLSSQGCRRIRS